jgi:uncharacterized membrane protein YfcA
MPDLLQYALFALAALAAGLVNALAGGGTLISFPALTMLGIPSVVANVTNTVALCPGYLGGTLAQMNDLRGQTQRLWWMLPAGALGGVVGGMLLLISGELFTQLVPFLILATSACWRRKTRRAWSPGAPRRRRTSGAGAGGAAVGLAAIYGGYFGAGLSVIVLAVLGLTLEDSLTRLNALKQGVAFATNLAAALYFVFSGQVNWPIAAVMAVGALIGGALGGRLAGQIKPATLRWMVVTIGQSGVVYPESLRFTA